MDEARWRQIDALLAEALERSKTERETFLEEQCGDDPELRRALDRLLALEEEAQGFLERPDPHTKGPTNEADPPAATPLVGETIGPYRLVRPLGHGGMGCVYLGRREQDYEQDVAIKVVRWGLVGPEIEQRFRAERQALAQLEHPNVARLYDGGTTAEGLSYLAMEHIEGLPIDRYCDHHRLPPAERLRLFQQVCAALAHAHRQLLVHCDIKPSNVLVTADGTPKLLDFGIAKLLRADDRTEGAATATSWRPFTPSYASPEQVLGKAITTASDVYSLGVLLYVLLCGALPHRPAAAVYSGLIQIVEHDPEPPSRRLVRAASSDPEAPDQVPDPAEISRRRGMQPRELRRRLEGDLDAIVLKAIRKEPAQRYASVDALSRDVGRHLEGRPVLARRGGWRYRIAKLLGRTLWPPDRRRRRERLSWAAALVAVLGIAGILSWLEEPALPCAQSATRLAGVWDDGTRTSVRASFLGTGHPFAQEAWPRIATRLDAYRDAWVRMHRETCEATHLYHQQSEPMLDARMLCLEGRRAELAALVELLTAADPTILANADEAAARLGGLRACADLPELSVLTPPPTNEDKRAAIRDATTVAETQLMRYRTRQSIDYDALKRTVSEARDLHYPPLLARLLYVLGLTEGMSGTDVAGGRAHLEEALLAAVEGGDRGAQTRISAALVKILARQLGEPEQARFWADFAEASLATQDSARYELRYEVAEALGLLAWETGDLAEASRRYQEALAVAERASDPVRQILALSSLAMFGGGGYVERAVAISDREFGPNHVLIARPLANRAANYGFDGRYDEGFDMARRALGILRNAFGDSHPDLGYLLTMLAQFRSSQGRPEEAIGYLEEALPLVTERLGANASLVAEVHHAYAQALHHSGRQDEALVHAEEADRIYAVSRPPEHFSRLFLLALVGSIQRDAGDLPAAITSHERLLESISAQGDLKSSSASRLLLAIGETFLATGRRGEARELLEHALRQTHEEDLWTAAQVRFTLAQALWPDDPLQARALAEQAVAQLDGEKPRFRRFRDEVEAWLRRPDPLISSEHGQR